jgi:micrococcal nuclease
MLRRIVLLLLVFTILYGASCHSKSGTYAKSTEINDSVFYGKVIGIVDGDTYDLLIDGNQTIRVRMEGIDAPEKGMPFYKVSKNYLGQLCFSKHVKLKKTGSDNHKRILGYTYLEDGTELGHEMIKAGLA